jgi:uncharacterized protein DUF6130
MNVKALAGKFVELSAQARACFAWGCATAIERRQQMKRIAFLSVAVAAVAGVVAATAPQAAREAAPPRSAREVRGPTPYAAVENEPPPKLIVDAPLPDLLDKGVVWIQYRTENVRIVPVFGKAALDVSPRVGHLHVRVDDLPWGWADASDLNTVDIGGMPPGEHKVVIELADANHQVFPGQARTVKFSVPQNASASH